MCPRGHELFVGSGSALGRLRWAVHARGCAACREVRGAERFVEHYAKRAGRWAWSSAAKRRWRLAASVAVIVALSPLLGYALREERTAALPLPKDVHVVHWVGTQTIHGQVLPMEMTEAFPDKERATLNGDTTVTDWSTGLSLNTRAKPISYPWHPMPFRYIRGRMMGRIKLSVNMYTLEGRLRMIREDGSKLVRYAALAPVDGREVYEAQALLKSAPWAPYIIKMEVDPKTHLLLSWEETNHAKDEKGQQYTWRVKVTRVEYNVKLPADYFSTEPPAGAEVMDYSTPEGLKRILTEALAAVEKRSGDPEKQRALVAEINRAHVFSYFHLRDLAPADWSAIVAKAKRYGISTRG